uniref:Protein kinase domain-containing protein n=1 Tax=Hordeum vulgare subsp. vulgare TaxID=112509 RepID=A0A8I6XRF2_HORVV
MVSWNLRPALKNYREKEAVHYCPIPPFCNIPWEEAGWVNEMLCSQESMSHNPDMDWISKPWNSTSPVGVCEAEHKMYYAYSMRLDLCTRRICGADADVCHTATKWLYTESLSYQTYGGLFLISGVLLSVLFLFSCIAGLVSWWCSRRREEPSNEGRGGGSTPIPQFEEPAMPRRYRYAELAAATGNFAENQRIGQGGFGSVYRGFLNNEGAGRHIAVKALRPESSAQGRKEFEAEVKATTRLSHRNIVQLLGWCECDDGGLLLVYELVPGGNLGKRLHSPAPNGSSHGLKGTFEIALGLGSALRYLHTEVEQYCVVHGDIKSSNVMIDSSGEAKLGDFGLARLLQHGADPRTTEVVAGTIGYIDPEFVNSRRPCAESDVYSFRRPAPGDRERQAADPACRAVGWSFGGGDAPGTCPRYA